jgi:hypothetical protein
LNFSNQFFSVWLENFRGSWRSPDLDNKGNNFQEDFLSEYWCPKLVFIISSSFSIHAWREKKIKKQSNPASG